MPSKTPRKQRAIHHLGLALVSFIQLVACPFVDPIVANDEPKPTTNWRYVAPPAGDAMEHAPFQPVALVSEKPSDLSENVKYRGKRRLYAQLRFGSPNSTRVTVVVDEVTPTDFDLYVDRNRDRKIEAKELVRGSGSLRRFPLDVQIVNENVLEEYARSLIVRRGAVGQTLGVATLGFMEGTAEVNGRAVKVRRVDGDANGLFADARDRIWIDRNNDGQWDAVTEQFPFLPVLRLDERRFAVRADQVGQRLAFQEIVGEGRLKLVLPGLSKKASIERLQVMLIGDDGSAFTVQGHEAATLPVGKYALGSITLSLRDGMTPEPWSFFFSRSTSEPPRRWYEVRADQEISIDPIGKLRFELNLARERVGPGQALSVSPRLFTGDDLLINSSARGELDLYSSSDKHNCAIVQLTLTSGDILDSHRSGFL